MTIKNKIKEFEELISIKIKEQSKIKEKHPYMHWSSNEFKQWSKLNSEISDLHGKIQALKDNDSEEVSSILTTGEWSWVAK